MTDPQVLGNISEDTGIALDFPMDKKDILRIWPGSAVSKIYIDNFNPKVHPFENSLLQILAQLPFSVF